jgi:hypothetical protein
MFGIHAALDRMPSDFDWTAQNIAQAFPGGDADLALHQFLVIPLPSRKTLEHLSQDARLDRAGTFRRGSVLSGHRR